MYTIIRRALDMVGRILDFERAHPDEANPGHAAAVARTTELVVRAEMLAQQELSGRRAVSAAVATRELLKTRITELMRVLAGVARAAARQEPDLGISLARPRSGGSNQAFLTRGRVAQATAVTHRAVLEQHGLPVGFADDLGKLLDELEVTVNEKNAGRAAHVGARSELEAILRELMSLARQLDAINQFRFRNQAELLGAWKSARNRVWPQPVKPAVAPVVKEGEAA